MHFITVYYFMNIIKVTILIEKVGQMIPLNIKFALQ